MPIYRTDTKPQPIVDIKKKLSELFNSAPDLQHITFFCEDKIPDQPVYPFCLYFGKNYKVNELLNEGEETLAKFDFTIGTYYIPSEFITGMPNDIDVLANLIKNFLQENYSLNGYCDSLKINDITFTRSIAVEKKAIVRYSIISTEFRITY